MKHTKGKWTVQELERDTYCIRAANNCHLATVGGVDRYYEKDAAANARLIAAAPTLLAVCVEAEATLRWAAQEANGKVKAEIVGGWLYHADKVQAAIAAATITEKTKMKYKAKITLETEADTQDEAAELLLMMMHDERVADGPNVEITEIED